MITQNQYDCAKPQQSSESNCTAVVKRQCSSLVIYNKDFGLDYAIMQSEMSYIVYMMSNSKSVIESLEPHPCPWCTYFYRRHPIVVSDEIKAAVEKTIRENIELYKMIESKLNR